MTTATTAVRSKDERVLPSVGTCETDLKHAAEKAGEACVDKAKDVATSVMDKAKDTAAAMAQAVGDAGAAVGAQAKGATAALGSGMESLAGSIRHTMPREGVLGSASSSVAESLDSGGRYLQQHGLAGMATDVTNLIRRHPVPALLAGVGVGFLLARVITRGLGHGK